MKINFHCYDSGNGNNLFKCVFSTLSCYLYVKYLSKSIFVCTEVRLATPLLIHHQSDKIFAIKQLIVFEASGLPSGKNGETWKNCEKWQPRPISTLVYLICDMIKQANHFRDNAFQTIILLNRDFIHIKTSPISDMNDAIEKT